MADGNGAGILLSFPQPPSQILRRPGCIDTDQDLLPSSQQLLEDTPGVLPPVIFNPPVPPGRLPRCQGGCREDP